MLTYADLHSSDSEAGVNSGERLELTCIRQHTSCIRQHTSSIRQHTSAYVSIRVDSGKRLEQTVVGSDDKSRVALVQQPLQNRLHTSAYVSIRLHTSAYVSIRQHTSAYVSIRQHTSAYTGDARCPRQTYADVCECRGAHDT
jgi:hypothetical protein